MLENTHLWEIQHSFLGNCIKIIRISQNCHFIENARCDTIDFPTPTLRLIYYSAPLIEMLSTKAQIDSDKVVEIVDAMKDHIIESNYLFMLAEQYQIILNMKQDKIADLRWNFSIRFVE